MLTMKATQTLKRRSKAFTFDYVVWLKAPIVHIEIIVHIVTMMD